MVEPGPGETPGEPRDPREPDDTVVDPGVLAERRARRAEQAEEAHARRAAEAEEALATAQAERHRAQVRLERVLEDRARLDAQLAARDRELRAARERAHAEERQRHEETAEAAERLDRLRSEAASLRRRVESAGGGELAALRERVARADAATARLRADLDAQIAAETGMRVALQSARASLAELRGLARPEAAEEVARRVAELRALADDLAGKLTVLEAERRTALASARRSDEARVVVQAERDALRDEAERTAAALLAARAAPVVDPGLHAELDKARGELAGSREREARTQALARELVATATTALTEAESRLAEAETLTRGLRDELTAERARREEDEAARAEVERGAQAEAAARVEAERGAQAASAARAEAERGAQAASAARAEAERARDVAIGELAALREAASVAKRARKEAARETEREHAEALRRAGRAREEAERGRREALRTAERAREDAGRARVVATAAERAAEEALGEARKARKKAADADRVGEELAARVAEAEAALARAAPVHDERTSAPLAAEIRLAGSRRPGPGATAAEARLLAAALAAPPPATSRPGEPVASPQREGGEDVGPRGIPPAAEDGSLLPAPRQGEALVATPVAAALAPAVAPGPGWLGRAVMELAGRDPANAAPLLLGLLPLHGLQVTRAVDYDLVLEPGGTWRVVVVPGRLAQVSPLGSPRMKKERDLRLEVDPAALAAALAGANARRARRAGHLRGTGSRRAARATLRALAATPLDLRSAARAGLYLPPPLAYLALSRAILPAWTGGWRFVLTHELTGQNGGTWDLHVDGAAPLRVSASAPGSPVATVRCSTAAFVPMLAGEPAPDGEKVGLRGDVAAVALVRRWLAGAQEGSPPAS